MLKLRLWVESLLWLSGSALLIYSLVTYSLAQANSQQAITELRARFDQQDVIVVRRSGAEVVPLPDQSLWSDQRIAAYNDVMEEPADRAVGLLEIPALTLLAPVFLGASDVNMNRGLGWIEGTAKPGDKGNLGIAGHRDGFFRPLKDLQLEQVVILRTDRGEVVYRVKSMEIVEPDAVEVLDPTDENSLTLVTCYPFYYVGDAPQRFIVKAVEM
jgi:sortase A